jgi:CubicO group peptidase (beta-lactamase class C family)
MKHSNIFFISLCLILVSCTSKPDPDIALIETIENNLLPTVMVEGEEVEDMNILERMEHYHIPGVSIAFLNEGEIVWAKGYGYTSNDSTHLVNESTLFQAASISKPVAAMAALSLVEEGKIGLDENVNLYLKDWQVEENKFTGEEKVTLRRILSHSAGLTVHGFGGYASDDEVPSTVQVLNGEEPANSGRIYPDTIPGVQHSYSGGGYTIMQLMLCDVTGKAFPELMEEAVLSKIGMKLSSYHQPLAEASWENAASGHHANGEMIEGRWHTYPEMAAAGLWTTPTDLLRYAIEVQQSFAGKSNLVISQEMTKEMLTPQKNMHGLGPVVGGSGELITFTHGGSNAGFMCSLYAFTKQGQGVAIMTNGDMGWQLRSEILRSFSKVYDWEEYKPSIKSIVPLSEQEIIRLAGQYQWTYQGEDLILEITVIENHIKGMQVWNDFPFEMYPESTTKFFNKDDGTDFEFAMDEEGAVTGITIYEGSQEYFFQKI